MSINKPLKDWLALFSIYWNLSLYCSSDVLAKHEVPTCISATAFFMDAVPLNDTTILLLLQPIKQRVSSCSSQKSSLSFKSYRFKAVGKLSTVLSSVVGESGTDTGQGLRAMLGALPLLLLPCRFMLACRPTTP